MGVRTTRIGINGLGRIGRQVLRMVFDDDGVEVVHVNDITHAEALASLLRFDTTYGPMAHRVRSDGDALWIDGRTISVSSVEDPCRIPWRERGVDVVLEATGVFRERCDAAQHLQAGARKVLVAVPGSALLDGEFVLGVNADDYDPRRHHVISIGRCTTHCLAPLARVLHEELGIAHGFATTVFAHTSAPELVDAQHVLRDPWHGGFASDGLVPTTTTAAATIGRLLPALEGRLQSLAIQAPVQCGSMLDLTCRVRRSTRAARVNELLRTWAEGPLRGILAVEDASLVSSDVIGAEHSAIVSAPDTRVLGGHLLKVLAWFDDEWAFSRRCVDMMGRML